MHRARQHAETRTRERRQRLAHEAARLMAESGIRDYHQAKRKAAERLGIFEDASLPRNREIEEALAEYQRLFRPSAGRAEQLARQRQAALEAMEFFAAFQPRLVGDVLDGSADQHSPVQLHLHADDPHQVATFLQQHAIPAQSRMRRVRLDRNRHLDIDVWLFAADDTGFDISVLPTTALRQAPLSALNEKPMPRASAAQLRMLLAENEMREHEETRTRHP
ncbi:hypothetical protein [Luteimonas sp. e5]